MKRIITLIVTALFAVTSFASNHDSKGNTNTPEQIDKVSYTIGFDMGKNFKQQDIQIKPEFIFKGMQDAIAGNTASFTEEEMAKALLDFQKEIITKRSEVFKKQAEENKRKGDAFLKENKKQKDIVTLPSGLQYKIFETGKGKKPSKNDTVTVEYTGKLIDGTVFDTTDGKNNPATFKVTRVIKGWTEALQLMQPGAKWEIYVPSELAYGQRGTHGRIGPNETLIFDIHLLSVEASKETDKKS